MPLRFNKEERDEWRSRMAGKSHTCAACCDGNCEDCSGTCDCSQCHGSKGASVLDALESKTAVRRPYTMGEDEPPGYEAWEQDQADPYEEGRCPACGGPSKLLGQLGNRTHYRCEHCGMDHSSEQPQMSYQDIIDREAHTAALPGEGRCTNCGTPMPYAGPRGNQYCPNCHMEHDPYGRPLGAPPAPVAQSHPREGEPLSQYDEPARMAKTADASMPPAAAPYEQKPTALPYNPAAYESGVEDMHPAAQYTYQRAVAQGADPQAAYQAAQEKQGEMGKRTQEGQNVEGVQIPVINTSYHGDKAGFISAATIERVSHLL